MPNAFQIPEAIKSIAPDADCVPVYRLSDLPRGGYAVRMIDYVTAGFGRGPREIKWYRRKGRQLTFVPTQKQVERFREVSEPPIAAMSAALDDATEYGNARRGYGACALTDVAPLLEPEENPCKTDYCWAFAPRAGRRITARGVSVQTT